MRGFPLLSTLIVIILLVLLRGPLYRTIAVGDSIDHVGLEDEQASSEEFSGDKDMSPALVKIVSTAEILKVRVEHKGQVIMEKSGGSSFEESLPELSIPSGGIEFWVEAKFVEKNQRVALGIEVEADTGDVWKCVLWGEDGVITDAATLRIQ